MALQAPAFVTLNPSYVEPELYIQNNQRSGFTDMLADGKPRVRIAEDDLLIYAKQVNVRTRVATGTASFNELPGVDISFSYFSTPTYLYKTRSQFDHHDVAAGGRWGVGLQEAYRLGMRQGCFQQARDAAIHGMNPQNGEGFLNAPNATRVLLPPDQNGNSTASTYDNGSMAFFLAQQFANLKTRTFQLGQGQNFTILGPQRTLALWEYNIVQLVQFQRDGAGSDSTFGTLENILAKNGDKLVWAYDDTLQGAGYNGADIVFMAMPDLKRPVGAEQINTNEFASLSPGNTVNLTQYCDMAAPREIISPLAAGATDFVMEWRTSSGWAPRGQALTIVDMPY